MVQLTEIPQLGDSGLSKLEYEKSWMFYKSPYRHRMYEILRSYKEVFLRPQVVSVLMEHLADCLQMEQRNDKHD